MTYKQRDYSERSYICDNCGKAAEVEFQWGEGVYPDGWLHLPWAFAPADACGRDCAVALSVAAIDFLVTPKVPA